MNEDKETRVNHLLNWMARNCAKAGEKGSAGFAEGKLWAEFVHTVEMLLELKNKDK